MDIEYLEGSKGIKILFEKTLQNTEKMLRTVLSSQPLVYLTGKEFSEEYMTKRSESKIFLKSLRLTSNGFDLPQHKNYAKFNKEVRVAPENVGIDKSLIIWDDYVAIVDTKRVSCVIIKNSENATVMKKWFDYVWTNSK